MKQFTILLFVLLSTTLWGQHNYKFNPLRPRAKQVQQNGNVRVQMIGEQPETRVNMFSALRTLWQIVPAQSPADFTFQVVDTHPDFIVSLKRKPNFTPTKPVYEITCFPGDTLSRASQILPDQWLEEQPEICYCKGKPLYGRVQVVDSNADFKIKVLDYVEDCFIEIRPNYYDPDIWLTYTDYNECPPKSCGEWLFVEHDPDFTVQVVDENPDFTVDRNFYKNLKSPLANESLKGEPLYTPDPEDPEPSDYNSIVDCHLRGIPLYGKVEVVNIGEDFKVKVANIGANLRIQVVDIAADECGKWQFVNIAADFKIRFVEIGEDFTIEYVNISPGQH